MMDEVIGEFRKLHNEEHNDMNSPNIIRLIKSRRIRWSGHVARTGRQERYIQGFGRETLGKENNWKTKAEMRGKY
jgi:hypothetical protein